MNIIYSFVYVTLVGVVNGASFSSRSEFPWSIVSREGWHAGTPRNTQLMKTPVPFVIIHHTFIPPACYSPEECTKAVQSVQHMHMIKNGWDDIGYSFLIGGDNSVYVGRGWNHVGAHSPSYNNQSIGICLIGDWSNKAPSRTMLHRAKQLIKYGVQEGKIQRSYSLFGHRQVRNGTECPGNTLFDEISTWEHFEKTPPWVWNPPATKPTS